jgi:hypothetical protein
MATVAKAIAIATVPWRRGMAAMVSTARNTACCCWRRRRAIAALKSTNF